MNKLYALQQSGDLEHVQRDLEQKAARQAMRPNPLALSTTRKPKTFRISPAVTVSHDVWTPDGHLIAKAGTRINPFERVHFLKTLIFLMQMMQDRLPGLKNITPTLSTLNLF